MVGSSKRAYVANQRAKTRATIRGEILNLPGNGLKIETMCSYPRIDVTITAKLPAKTHDFLGEKTHMYLSLDHLKHRIRMMHFLLDNKEIFLTR